MLIRITKGRDGPNTLTCIRADGSSTWAKVQDYFPVHDITHFVVETTLAIPNAFYSLVRDGWDIDDFAMKGSAKRVPAEANLVEAIVGRLQRDLMPGADFTAASFNEEVLGVLEGIGNPARRPISDSELAALRIELRRHLASWKALAPGESSTWSSRTSDCHRKKKRSSTRDDIRRPDRRGSLDSKHCDVTT